MPFSKACPRTRAVRVVVLGLGLLLLTSCTTILRTREEVALPAKTLLVTFDDGPSETPGVDDQILDVLRRHGVHAHFCLLTSKIAGSGPLLNRMVDEGHTIVFHSRNHDQVLTKSVDDLLADLAEFEAVLRQESDREIPVRWFRPPVGVLSLALQEGLGARGIGILPATHNPTDTFVSRRDAQAYLDNLLRHFRSQQGGILVLHNGSELFPRPSPQDFENPDSPAHRGWVADGLDEFLTAFEAEGYRFAREL